MPKPKPRKSTAKSPGLDFTPPTVKDLTRSLEIVEDWIHFVRKSLESMDEDMRVRVPRPPFPRITPPEGRNC
jgi:hypothetical protein